MNACHRLPWNRGHCSPFTSLVKKDATDKSCHSGLVTPTKTPVKCRKIKKKEMTAFTGTLLPLLICCVGQLVRLTDVAGHRTIENNKPIIGVLTQEYLGEYNSLKGKCSFIASTYIKFIESAGGRVVPIHVNRSLDYYKYMISRVNGILLPGGDQDLEHSSFTVASNIIYQLAINLNAQGIHFPIWGTCQGYEVLTYLYTNRSHLTTSVGMEDTPAKVNFLLQYEHLTKESRIFKHLTQSQYTDMTTNKIAIHYHQWCLSMANFTRYNFTNEYQPLATVTDANGTECVTIIESKHLPIYATQFHPEFLFTYKDSPGFMNIIHTPQAIQMAQMFGNFFVDQTRLNENRFDNKSDEANHLIYSYTPHYITSDVEPYDEIYFFPLNYHSHDSHECDGMVSIETKRVKENSTL